MKKYLKIALLVVVAAIFIFTFVFLYQKSKPKITVYDTVTPTVADLEKTTVATGKVEPRDEILIKPQISGIIDELYKEAGQTIRKGEVIAKVKVIPELGTLNSAESRVRLAELNAKQGETDFARIEKLFEDKLISREEYEKAEVSVKQVREAGQTIRKGEVIAKVKVIPELGTLNSAESRVRLAELNAKQGETDFARIEKLFEDKLISREEYEKAEVSVKQVREELQTAKDNLEIVKEGITKSSASFSSTLIRSTIDGLILDVPVKAGNSVIMSNTFNDGTTIATVANMNDLIFRGKIDETEVGRVHEGMPVKLTIGALQNLSFDAILEYISPKGVEENGANQFEIKAAIQVPDTVMIRSGYSANAEIVLERAQKALTLPESTIEFSGDSTFVYVMTDSVPAQKFERKEVKVGMSDGIKIVIKDGVDGKAKVRGAEKKDK